MVFHFQAIICALRIVRKVPDLSEAIIDKVPLLLTDRNHGVLVATVQLATTLALQEPSSFSYIQKTIPILIRLMKTLLLSTYGVEHDVAGIADPFLQVKAIRLLRVLLQKADTVPPEVVELLTQVTTNTEGRKNAGHAILYECCFTIISLNVPVVLRSAAINMIGRFLAHRDPNLRYVALQTLAQIPEEDLPSIRRYHETIVQCLRYPDPSLRRRSLDLISSLVNAENAQKLVPELIHYLSSGDDDFREDLCEKLSNVIERYARRPSFTFTYHL
jgi:AP-1 complex subunit gamma-1